VWNPLTPFLTLFRSALLPWHPFAWSELGLAALWAVVFCTLGVLVFRRLEGGLKDVVG
jgi:ABC-type polysaccharide/polyol phosphate export permease